MNLVIDKTKLTLIMADKCLTLSELCQITGIPKPTINNIVKGKKVKPVTVGKLAKGLGVPVSFLIVEEVKAE